MKEMSRRSLIIGVARANEFETDEHEGDGDDRTIDFDDDDRDDQSSARTK